MEKDKTIELVKEGFANGVAPGGPVSDAEKQKMIEDATKAFGEFFRCT